MSLTKVTYSMIDARFANVLDYGADPTGAADSTVAIQTAITDNAAVFIPAGTYRCDNTITIMSSYANRKHVVMTAATKLQRLSAHSAATGPVIEHLGNYGHFDGGFGELMTENNSPRGVVCLGQADQTTSNYNGLYWNFENCDVRTKDFTGTSPAADAGVGVFIPSSQPLLGSSFANYFGTVSNVRVFDATTAFWLTDLANAHTFVNCFVDFYWSYAYRLNGAYGNTFYGGFINGSKRNNSNAIFLANKLNPAFPFASTLQSSSNNFFGMTIELYTTGNVGVEVQAGTGSPLEECVHNFCQINWNSSGNAFIDNTSAATNTISTGATQFRFGDSIELTDSASLGIKLLKIGNLTYTTAHCIARTSASGAPALIVENLNTASAIAAGLEVVWNTPTIGFNSSIISAYHAPTTATVFKVLDNGNVENTNNSYGAISDAKLKDVVSLAGSQWDDVKFLASKLTKYSLKSDPDKRVQLGWIAQEIEEQCPGLVFETPDVRRVEGTDEDGNPAVSQELTGETTKSVRYSIAELKAFKALGEALERIEALEAQVALLKA
jgi:hypothetical protein